MNDSSNGPVYFAADEAQRTASNLLGKATTFYNDLNQNAYLNKLHKMWRAYNGIYNNNNTDHGVGFTGEQGELVQLPVNHFRNLAQHIYTMITANRPVMDARPVNTDYKSISQTVVANGILEYYMREKGLEECLKRAAEMGIVMGAGFIKLEWNATSGEEYDVDPETGELAYEGDLEFSNLSPLDVVVDGTKESWDHEWILTRTFKNRFNLMAKYPEYADKIRALPTKNDIYKYKMAIWSNDNTDDVPVYEFYHKRSEALPDGRYLLFLSDDIVLLDTKLPYRTIPIFRIAPSTILGTSYGYTPMFDVFPIQEGINSLYSAIMTNQNAFMVQNVFVKRGSNINVNNLEGGLNVIEGDEKPEALNLTQTPAEVFKFLEMLIESAETISGVNSVARGNPEASLRSGTALALIQSMAIQFISGFQQSYVKLIEDSGTAVLNILKDFATTPKVIALVGKNNRPLLREFTGEDINSISRVIVDVGNPLSRTIAGRVQMAEQMLQMGVFKNPQQYFQVLETGKLQTMYEGDMSQLLLVKRENEWMLEGKKVLANPLDQHRLHIMEHQALSADPDLREDVGLMQAVNMHIQEHIDMLRTVDPDLLMMIGEQPLQPQVPPGVGPEGQPAPGGQPPEGDMGAVLEPQSGLPRAGDEMETGIGPNTSIPALPTPPAPFSDLPVTPEGIGN
jgi:hypothetical protein